MPFAVPVFVNGQHLTISTKCGRYLRAEVDAELARREAKAKAVEAKREPRAGEIWCVPFVNGVEYCIVTDDEKVTWISDTESRGHHDESSIFSYSGVSFCASSLDEFVAKRAVEIGMDGTALKYALDELEKLCVGLGKPAPRTIGTFIRWLVAERDALQAKLSSPAAVAVDNIAKDGACVLVSADHFAKLERAKKAMERIRKGLGSHGEETSNSPECIADVVEEVLAERKVLRAELHAPGIVRVPQERYNELMKAEEERAHLADMRRIVAKTLGIALP